MIASALSNVYLTPSFAQGALTEAEQVHLVFMREEEKLARDVYIHLYGIWGSQIFRSIAASE